MTIRGEAFIPEGHPLDKVRSRVDAWRGVLNNPDLKVVVAFSLLGLFAALYMAIHFPLPEQMWFAPIIVT
jgi:hypothetical protein